LKTILITGATGFIGRYIASRFSNDGWNVIGLGSSNLENELDTNLSCYKNIRLPSSELSALIRQVNPDVCVHCAGKSSVARSIYNPYDDFETNVHATFSLLDSLRLYSPQCSLIYLSSAAVYGNPKTLPIYEYQELEPISPYGFHKLMSEQLCKEFFKIYGLKTAIIRIFSAYGKGLKRQVIWDICQRAISQPTLELQGTGQETRDFIHADDIAEAVYIVCQKSIFEANIYNLASGKETTIKYLAELIISKLGKANSLIFNGMVPVGNPINWKANISCLEEIGFTSKITLEQGISDYCEWYRCKIMG
jgi:UDP-glucose 4-epimerase